jgi:PAS domain-containing protein
MGIIGKLQVEGADITGLNYIRKKVMLALMPHYTADLLTGLRIAEEIDRYIHAQATASFALLTQFHRDAADAHQRFIERVSAAVPGTLYVYNVQSGRVEYINDHLPSLLGYTPEEFVELGENVMAAVIAAADQADVGQYFADILTLEDGEVRTHKYRSVHKDGTATIRPSVVPRTVRLHTSSDFLSTSPPRSAQRRPSMKVSTGCLKRRTLHELVLMR